MMKASPSTAFEMPEPDLLLELLIVALDPPAQLGEVDQTMQSNVLGEGREPVFGRFLLAFGPLDQQPFFRSALAALKSRRAARTRTRAKREDRRSAVPSRHAIVCQARLGKPSASSLTETG